MSTRRDEIEEWFRGGSERHARYLLVVADTFSHEDYPTYAKDDDECRRKMADCTTENMQRVVEIYDLRAPMEPQLNMHRAWFPPPNV